MKYFLFASILGLVQLTSKVDHRLIFDVGILRGNNRFSAKGDVLHELFRATDYTHAKLTA